MGDLKNIMKPHSYMVMSGILDEKKQIVIDSANEHNLKVIEILQQEQWIAIVAQKV